VTFSFVYDVNPRHIQALMLSGLDAAGGVSQVDANRPDCKPAVALPPLRGLQDQFFCWLRKHGPFENLGVFELLSPASF